MSDHHHDFVVRLQHEVQIATSMFHLKAAITDLIKEFDDKARTKAAAKRLKNLSRKRLKQRKKLTLGSTIRKNNVQTWRINS